MAPTSTITGRVALIGPTTVSYTHLDVYKRQLYNNETHNDEEIKLYMIGYNQGPTLALTNDGIKVQITQGYISQNTCLLYPSLLL